MRKNSLLGNSGILKRSCPGLFAIHVCLQGVNKNCLASFNPLFLFVQLTVEGRVRAPWKSVSLKDSHVDYLKWLQKRSANSASGSCQIVQETSFWRLRALEILGWVGGSWPAQGGSTAALGAASIPFYLFPYIWLNIYIIILIEYLHNYNWVFVSGSSKDL